MGRKLKVEGPATPQEVEVAYRASKDKHDRERLLAIRLAQQGKWTLGGIGEIIGRGRRTIARWVKAFREDGLPGVLERGHGGRQASLGQSDLEALKEGLRSGRWKTAKEIQGWLQQERGIDLKLGVSTTGWSGCGQVGNCLGRVT